MTCLCSSMDVVPNPAARYLSTNDGCLSVGMNVIHFSGNGTMSMAMENLVDNQDDGMSATSQQISVHILLDL